MLKWKTFLIYSIHKFSKMENLNGGVFLIIFQKEYCMAFSVALFQML